MKLRQSLFWDVDVNTINFQEHKAAVIERITLRGRFEEFREMLQFYGRDTVIEVLVNTRFLDKKTLAFCSGYFNVPKTDFRCYKLAQSNPEHWSY